MGLRTNALSIEFLQKALASFGEAKNRMCLLPFTTRYLELNGKSKEYKGKECKGNANKNLNDMIEEKITERATNEAFLQLMKVSGNSLLKLFGFAANEAEKYYFQAVILKELKPDIEDFPTSKLCRCTPV